MLLKKTLLKSHVLFAQLHQFGGTFSHNLYENVCFHTSHINRHQFSCKKLHQLLLYCQVKLLILHRNVFYNIYFFLPRLLFLRTLNMINNLNKENKEGLYGVKCFVLGWCSMLSKNDISAMHTFFVDLSQTASTQNGTTIKNLFKQPYMNL